MNSRKIGIGWINTGIIFLLIGGVTLLLGKLFGDMIVYGLDGFSEYFFVVMILLGMINIFIGIRKLLILIRREEETK